ncbi:MAG TPA: TadE family protein [Acidimicrobiia bacterium]|nr:TadE family protein [Acidimicrobiia bacterium]
MAAASSRSPESGAAAVEFALLASLLFMLIFGSISAGISFSRSNALQTAAREGARFAATLPGEGSGAWFTDVIAATQGAALGELANGIPGRTICVAYIVSGSSGATASLNAAGTTSTTPTGASCFTDGLTDGPRVQVAVRRETEIQAVLFSTTIDVGGDAVARYER